MGAELPAVSMPRVNTLTWRQFFFPPQELQRLHLHVKIKSKAYAAPRGQSITEASLPPAASEPGCASEKTRGARGNLAEETRR